MLSSASSSRTDTILLSYGLWNCRGFAACQVRRTSPPDLTVSPHPWQRTGPGTATDGGLKFDLTKFDQSYFDRLRTRTEMLRNAGIYVGVYLFTGEFLNHSAARATDTRSRGPTISMPLMMAMTADHKGSEPSP